MKKTLYTCLFLFLLPGVASPANEQVVITEWPVPWQNTRPRDPFAENVERIWFVGQGGDYVGRMNPVDGVFRRYELEQGTGPHNLIVDDKGTVWYAGNLDAHIGRLDPSSGDIKRYPMPDPDAGDPHTLVFDNKGDIWFTVQWGNFIGRLDTDTGDIQLIPVPTEKARPYGIIIAGSQVWFTEFGANKLGTIDPSTMTLWEIEMPRSEARPRRLATTADGSIWYVDYAKGFLGRFSPATGDFREWRTPAGDEAYPYGMAVDDKDRLWFVETGPSPNRLVGFDPKTETFFSITGIESGGGSVRHMHFHKDTGVIWFGTDTNTIGRAKVQ